MLFMAPQFGWNASLSWVNCRQWPIGPTHISEACAAELAIKADAEFPSAASDIEGSPEYEVLMLSGPFQICETFPLGTSTSPTPVLPSIFSANVILAGRCQYKSDGEAEISGVMSFATPPEAGTTKMSPPITPSSLMMPLMNAIRCPSGDQRGAAICKCGR